MQIFHETQAKKTTAATAAEGALDAAVILSPGPARTVRPTPGAGHPGLSQKSETTFSKQFCPNIFFIFSLLGFRLEH